MLFLLSCGAVECIYRPGCRTQEVAHATAHKKTHHWGTARQCHSLALRYTVPGTYFFFFRKMEKPIIRVSQVLPKVPGDGYESDMLKIGVVVWFYAIPCNLYTAQTSIYICLSTSSTALICTHYDSLSIPQVFQWQDQPARNAESPRRCGKCHQSWRLSSKHQ